MSVGANIRYTGIFIENSNAIISPAVDQVRYLANSHVWQTWGAGINSNLPLKTINAIGNHNTVMTLSNLNVGIGTTQPLDKLHIKESINNPLSTQILLQNEGNGSTGAGIAFQVSHQSETTAYAPKAAIIYERLNTFGVGDLKFFNKATSDTVSFVAADERMRIASSGNVGIGTTIPLSKLHVDSGSLGGTIGNTLDHIRSRCSSTNQHNLRIFEERHTTGSDWTTTSLAIQRVIDTTNHAFIKFGVAGANTGLTLGAANTEVIRLSDAGNVGIGTTIPNQKLHVQGNIYASGDITAMSDSRYKTNLQIIQNPLNIIKEIHGYTFTRNDIDSTQRYLGVIAQEVQKVLPEAISESTNGYLSVAYGNLNALLIEGMRELMEELHICKERISLLEQKI